MSITPYLTRLNTLRALEHNWRYLSFPAPSQRVRVPFRTTYVYELSGGYFILGSDRTTQPPDSAATANETVDGWLSIDTMNKTMQLNFLRLPHLVHDAESKASKGKDRAETELAWRHLPLPFPIADFGIDASQDLLVLMQRYRLGTGHSFKFHLYTLEGTPHPQASVTTLSAQPPAVSLHAPNPPSWDWAVVHISRSTLVVLLCSQHGSGGVLIWDWRQGIPLVEDSTPEYIHDISLIAPNILAAPCTEHGCIDILTFLTEQDTETTAVPQQLRLLHRLTLPFQGQESEERRGTYGDISARLHPPPFSSVLHRPKYSGLHPGSAATLPFETDPEDGIVVYSMRLLRTSTPDFTLVVHRSALINPLEWSEAELSRAIENAAARPLWSDMKSRKPVKDGVELPDLSKVSIPWREWGPKHTRWIDGVRSARWICWVHGHRLVEIEEWEPQQTNESVLADQKAKKMVKRAIRRYREKQAREASLGADGAPSLPGTVLRGEVVSMEEDDCENAEDDIWDAEIDPNIPFFLDAMPEEEQVELMEALMKVYAFLPANPAHYLRVWDFNPRTVRRALGERSLQVAPDVLPTPDVAVIRGPVVVIERGGKPEEDEPGTCLPYTLTTVKLDVPVDRTKKRGVVLDGEHIILVETNNDTETTELVQVFSL